MLFLPKHAWAEKAKSLGFKAVKSEVTLNGPYAHSGLHEEDDKSTEIVAAVRKALGSDIKLMIDVQYRWKNAEEALRTVKDWAEFDIYFLETPVWTDDIKSYARMHDEAPMKIAAGEWLSTRYEFEDLIVNGKINGFSYNNRISWYNRNDCRCYDLCRRFGILH